LICLKNQITGDLELKVVIISCKVLLEISCIKYELILKLGINWVHLVLHSDLVMAINFLALGDELLMWTIETFTLFYERTWAQRYGFPLMKLIPLLFSFFVFVYDFYSDVELTREYYDGAFGTNHTETNNRTLAEEPDCTKVSQFLSSTEIGIKLISYNNLILAFFRQR
jgi:hypothetical protein